MGIMEDDPYLNTGLEIDLLEQPQFTDLQNLEGMKRAAVLVPLFLDAHGWEILYTRRSESVQHHKGQVSFPGGAVDENDNGPVSTALREANEEINIEKAAVKISGFLPDVVSITDYVITPVVGVLGSLKDVQIRSHEVDRIFSVPLLFFAEISNSYIQERILPSGTRIQIPFYKEYRGELVWGITAQITRELIQRIK